MDILSSNSNVMMEKSLEFLWTKQGAILDNIANAETPNYKPKAVKFEEGLRAKLENAANGAAPTRAIRETLEDSRITVERQHECTRMDDNGVNVTEQNAEMIRNAYQMQYVMRSISDDLGRLRSAIRG